MKRIHARSVIREFWELHPDTEQYLRNWFDQVLLSDWKTPNDVKKDFSRVSILKNGRLVFDIKGNSYRLVVKVNYVELWVFIRFIGTHEEYDKIDANSI
jgi:mRNA interferase HigB